MSDAREDMLGRIRAALGRGAVEGDAADALERRLAAHPRSLMPARANALDAGARVALFAAMGEEADATVARVAASAEIPSAIARHLADRKSC